MAEKADAGIEFKTLVTEIGVPENLTLDGYKYQNAPGKYLMKIF